MTLGERIVKRAQELEISQRELAEKANVTEVALARYISGDRFPKNAALNNIAMVLGVTPEELLADEDAKGQYIERAVRISERRMRIELKLKEALRICTLLCGTENTDDVQLATDIMEGRKGCSGYFIGIKNINKQ